MDGKGVPSQGFQRPPQDGIRRRTCECFWGRGIAPPPVFWSQRPPNMACKFSIFLADRIQLVASYRGSYWNFSLLGGGSGWGGKDMKHLRLGRLAISLLPWPWVSSSSLVGGGRSSFTTCPCKEGTERELTYPSLPEASSRTLEKPHPSFWPLEGSRIEDLRGVAIIPLGNWRSWLLSDSSASFLRETPFKAREDKGSREEHSTRGVKDRGRGKGKAISSYEGVCRKI